MNETINENQPDLLSIDTIRTYLKVRLPTYIDKSFFEISQNKQMLTLHDPLWKAYSEKSLKFEVDKIFTTDDEHSTIYNEICRDTVPESWKNTNFVFISYGETISDKQSILWLDNNKDCITDQFSGLFPQVLNQLLQHVSSDNTLTEKIMVSLSYICLNGNKVIDWSNYMDKDISSLNENTFVNSGWLLNTGNKDLITSMKRIPTESVNDVALFIKTILTTFQKLDHKSNYHWYTQSYFIFIIYINDNNGKLISTLTFILLNGSELLNLNNNPSGEGGSTKNVNRIDKKEQIKQSKVSVDTQFIYDSIITTISHNKKFHNSYTKEYSDYIEKTPLELSKLTTLLYNVCFDPLIMNCKYKIIGSIAPNTGSYLIVKETLMFLFENQKIMRKKFYTENNGDNEKTAKKEEESPMERDDVIFDLENKLKWQEKKIQEGLERISEKKNKISELESNYKKQVEVLTQSFHFVGDVNILLSGDQYTKEARAARNIREALDNVRIKKKQIIEWEEKLNKEKEKLRSMKDKYETKAKSEKMIEHHPNVPKKKEIDEDEEKYKSESFAQIKKLEEVNKSKDKIISDLKEEIEAKNKAIFNFPNWINNKADKNYTTTQMKDLTLKTYEDKLKKEMSQINNQNTNDIIQWKTKYESWIKQKEELIKKNAESLETWLAQYKSDKICFGNELVHLDEIMMTLVKKFKYWFLLPERQKGWTNISTWTSSKDEFEREILTSEDEINNYSFPNWYKILNEQNKLGINNTSLINKKKSKTNVNRPQSSILPKSVRSIEERDSYRNSLNNILLNKGVESNIVDEVDSLKNSGINSQSFNEPQPKEMQDINKTKSTKGKVPLNKDTLMQMSNEEVINQCLEINKRWDEIDKFAEKYSQFKRGFDIKEFNSSEVEMEELSKKIEKLNNKLIEQIDINNRNKIIASSLERTIIKLREDNWQLHNHGRNKQEGEKMGCPVLTSWTYMGRHNLISESNHWNTNPKTELNSFFTNLNTKSDAIKVNSQCNISVNNKMMNNESSNNYFNNQNKKKASNNLTVSTRPNSKIKKIKGRWPRRLGEFLIWIMR